ncbi:hypothetical protein D3C71_1617160 [compost metagenome]
MQVKQREQREAGYCADQQRHVVIACILWPKAYRQRIFAVGAVAFDIAQIIDVQHRGGQQAAGRGRQHHDTVERMGLQVVGACHAQPAKEHQHRNVTQPQIAIGFGADGIGNGGDDRQPAQHQEAHHVAGLFAGHGDQ